MMTRSYIICQRIQTQQSQHNLFIRQQALYRCSHLVYFIIIYFIIYF